MHVRLSTRSDVVIILVAAYVGWSIRRVHEKTCKASSSRKGKS
jgi:hypothetical protein